MPQRGCARVNFTCMFGTRACYVTDLFMNCIQLTLFHSDEVLDDDYTLMDVAYITAWNAVSIASIS